MANEAAHPDDPNRSHDDHADEPADQHVIIIHETSPATREQPGQLQERRRAGLPAPVTKAAVAVAAGAAIQMGIGLASRYLAYRAGKSAAEGIGTQAVRAASSRKSKEKEKHKLKRKSKQDSDPAVDEGEMISETLIVRRVWKRKARD